MPNLQNQGMQFMVGICLIWFILGMTVAATLPPWLGSEFGLDEVADGSWGDGPGGHVGLFEGDVDVPAGGQEQRRLGPDVTDGQRLDVGGQTLSGIEGGDGERSVGRPGGRGWSSSSCQMAWARPCGSRGASGKGSIMRKWMPLRRKSAALSTNSATAVLAVLVAGGDDLDHGHDPAEFLVNREAVGLEGVAGRLGSGPGRLDGSEEGNRRPRLPRLARALGAGGRPCRVRGR